MSDEKKNFPDEIVEEEHDGRGGPEKVPSEGSNLWLYLIVAGIVIMLIAPVFMFAISPALKKAPEDLDTSTEYRGSITMLDLETLSYDTYNISVLDTYKAIGFDGDSLTVEFTETITHDETGARLAALETADYTYECDRQTFEYQDDDHEGHWIFPLAVEKKDYDFWNGDIGTTTVCKFITTEDHEGVETYKFEMSENGLVLDLEDVFDDQETVALVQGMGGVMTYDVTITFWVDPATGTIIDLQKSQERHLTFPNLRYIPDDLEMISVNEGTISVMNSTTYAMETVNAVFVAEITAVETIMDGGVLVVNEVLTVTDTDHDMELAEFGHNETYCVNRATGEYVYVEGTSTVDRLDRFSFPVGVEERDYLWYTSTAGNKYYAECLGQEMRLGIPVYNFSLEYETEEYSHPTMGITVFERHDVTMWVEPNSGAVVDRSVETAIYFEHPSYGWTPLSIVKYSTNQTHAARGAVEAYQTGMKLAFLSDNTVPVLDQDVGYSDAQISSSKERALDTQSSFRLLDVYIPLMIATVALVMLALGVVVKYRKNKA